MEVEGLKLSSSFYFADYDQFKSIVYKKINLCQNLRLFRGLSPLPLNIRCKTFQFCKAGKIVSKFIILLLTFYTRSLSCLIF